MSAKFRLTRNAYGFPPTQYSLRGKANLTRTLIERAALFPLSGDGR